MTRDKQFALTVQTLVLVRERRDETMGDSLCSQIVAHAARLPEEIVPTVVADAARAFVGWYCGEREKPEWLP